MFPSWAGSPVAAIDEALVFRCLQPIWKSKTTTANRVRRRVEAVLDFAKVSKWRDGDNPTAAEELVTIRQPTLRHVREAAE